MQAMTLEQQRQIAINECLRITQHLASLAIRKRPIHEITQHDYANRRVYCDSCESWHDKRDMDAIPASERFTFNDLNT